MKLPTAEAIHASNVTRATATPTQEHEAIANIEAKMHAYLADLNPFSAMTKEQTDKGTQRLIHALVEDIARPGILTDERRDQLAKRRQARRLARKEG